MADLNETWQSLVAQMQELRETITQQQAQLQALQARLETEKTTAGPVADSAGSVTAALQGKRPAKTSRRRLLTTAGAAAAAATAAAVVLGGAREADAVPAHTDTSTFQQSANGVGNVAVEGDGTSGARGVHGASDSAEGVWGSSSSGPGVWGSSGSSFGVKGTSNSGIGVIGGSTTGIGGFFEGGAAQISLLPAGGAAGAPTSGIHGAGDIYLDSAATLWVCTNNGTPGTWTRLTRVANGTTGGSVNYLAAPVRLLDARSGATSGLVNRGPLTANEIYALSVAGLAGSGIPAGALGLICNVTVLGPSQNGNLSLFPTGAPIPTTASMTFVAGAFLANHVSAALGGGKVNIQNQSGGNTPLVVDAVGFIM